MKATEKLDVREIRRKLGMNQQQFWSRLGVTQSGGSRYESGRNIPRPVQQLLRLVHVEQIDIAKIKREDFEVVEYLKSNDPTLFKSLKKQARASQKKRGVTSCPIGSGADLHRQPPIAQARGHLIQPRFRDRTEARRFGLGRPSGQAVKTNTANNLALHRQEINQRVELGGR